MKPSTQIRNSLRLFEDLEDLMAQGMLSDHQGLLLYNALTAWIGLQMTPEMAALSRLTLPTQRNRVYWLQERLSAPSRLWVKENGLPLRQITHVPIFCPYGFGRESLAARDTALALLADLFDEPLQKRTFVRGQGRACWYYAPLAADLATRWSAGVIKEESLMRRLMSWQHHASPPWARPAPTLIPPPSRGGHRSFRPPPKGKGSR